jgi:hypothetical protein
MGFRDRAMEAAAELMAARRKEYEQHEAILAAARKREKEYLGQLIRSRLARWCTGMGIDQPTPDFTVVKSKGSLESSWTLDGNQDPYFQLTFRFSVEDLNFEGDYWASGFRKPGTRTSTSVGAEEELRRPPGDESLKIYLSSDLAHLDGYEINDLAGLAAAINRG